MGWAMSCFGPRAHSTASTRFTESSGRQSDTTAGFFWESGQNGSRHHVFAGAPWVHPADRLAPATMFLPREIAANHFDLLDIGLRHATFVETLPSNHKDRFDRLLNAQAIIEAIPIVRVDVDFDPYGVARLW
jgi:hypothetical protein